MKGLVLTSINVLVTEQMWLQTFKGSTSNFLHFSHKRHRVYVWCYAHILNIVLADRTGYTVSSEYIFYLLNDITSIHGSYKCIDVWEVVSKDRRQKYCFYRRKAVVVERQALCTLSLFCKS